MIQEPSWVADLRAARDAIMTTIDELDSRRRVSIPYASRLRRGRRVRVSFTGVVYGPVPDGAGRVIAYRVMVGDWCAEVPVASVTAVVGGKK